MENPTEDTQWNDVLRQKGIIPPKPKEAEITEEQIENMVENVVKTYTSKEQKPEELELDDLDGLEDELDEKVFLEYRQKRIAEMKASIKSNKFGEVLEITGKDYVQEVNKAGEGIWVILHLYKQGIPLSSLINEHFRNLANKFPMLKFVKSLAGLCIANYPDQNLPTIFVYHNGDLKHQFIGANCFASGIKQDELEWMLSETGALKTKIEKDPRPKIRDALFSQLNGGNTQSIESRDYNDDSE
ncbi:phosducin-like protein 3 [Daphnia magna]|uniref:Phosducin domain-containing protein n=2 Tax=Daphnia magna TaxID=35525 RepID=A0ABR0AIK5_9CRUS|nr:phosducin-like protein 3 [Daphnia magna]XP_032780600.1 phosducin-like protein 3 [Daphnia magna]XP_045026959.1 phosducin-like protein 3 [Daphnia magna]KAK4024908.1 hypothetical protein OUZ56_010400 [Daphnia magna]